MRSRGGSGRHTARELAHFTEAELEAAEACALERLERREDAETVPPPPVLLSTDPWPSHEPQRPEELADLVRRVRLRLVGDRVGPGDYRLFESRRPAFEERVEGSGRTRTEVLGELLYAGVAEALHADPDAELEELVDAARAAVDRTLRAETPARPVELPESDARAEESARTLQLHAAALLGGSAGGWEAFVAHMADAMPDDRAAEGLRRLRLATPRQRDILAALVVTGGTREAAELLGISPSTIRGQLHRLRSM